MGRRWDWRTKTALVKGVAQRVVAPEPPWLVHGIWDKGPHVAPLQLRICFGMRMSWLVGTESLRRRCREAPLGSEVYSGVPWRAYKTGRGFKIAVDSVRTIAKPLSDEMMAFAPDGPDTYRKGNAAESAALLLLPGSWGAEKKENIGGTDLWWDHKGTLYGVQVKHDRWPGIDGHFWVQTHERH